MAVTQKPDDSLKKIVKVWKEKMFSLDRIVYIWNFYLKEKVCIDINVLPNFISKLVTLQM